MSLLKNVIMHMLLPIMFLLLVILVAFSKRPDVPNIDETKISNWLDFPKQISGKLYFCQQEGVDFGRVRKLITTDERIGPSHSFVTEERGFGGHCFPKDLAAMIYFGEKSSGDTSFLKAVQEYNDTCRKIRDWEQMKGRAVSDD